jgi:hypothetical protein
LADRARASQLVGPPRRVRRHPRRPPARCRPNLVAGVEGRRPRGRAVGRSRPRRGGAALALAHDQYAVVSAADDDRLADPRSRIERRKSLSSCGSNRVLVPMTRVLGSTCSSSPTGSSGAVSSWSAGCGFSVMVTVALPIDVPHRYRDGGVPAGTRRFGRWRRARRGFRLAGPGGPTRPTSSRGRPRRRFTRAGRHGFIDVVWTALPSCGAPPAVIAFGGSHPLRAAVASRPGTATRTDRRAARAASSPTTWDAPRHALSTTARSSSCWRCRRSGLRSGAVPPVTASTTDRPRSACSVSSTAGVGPQLQR